ncbi:MAG: hypothetical protein HY054_14025 [Proteobacteria bacterium]|nr:hypothetical protein [Pseudomonadota bacterium]
MSPSGATLWKLRQDFAGSSWDAPSAATFDLNGQLVIVGGSVLDDSGDDFAR